ncbi:CIC11C00000004860 [Sungouiella intermedia]|uniref:CIC11C00000004860 n=1 Tax=Sungouiella intermedia TaxID=45354 RepID=A0A1L0BH26_9ASCO|nr:CIC11C00000004860 [[Candida] intermedia]
MSLLRLSHHVRTFIRSIRITTWNESEIITDRKSRFQARHTDLLDVNDIPDIINQFLAQHKNIAKSASHPHILAWRIGTPSQDSSENDGTRQRTRKSGKNDNKNQTKNENKHSSSTQSLSTAPITLQYTNIVQGFKDNGEKGAGAKLLEHMVQQNVINKLFIVTRWYGGSPIGSSRFRHISNAAFDSLRKANTNRSN